MPKKTCVSHNLEGCNWGGTTSVSVLVVHCYASQPQHTTYNNSTLRTHSVHKELTARPCSAPINPSPPNPQQHKKNASLTPACVTDMLVVVATPPRTAQQVYTRRDSADSALPCLLTRTHHTVHPLCQKVIGRNGLFSKELTTRHLRPHVRACGCVHQTHERQHPRATRESCLVVRLHPPDA